MATAATTFPSYDRTIPTSSSVFHMSNDPMLSREAHGFFTASTNPGVTRLGHCLDGKLNILNMKPLT